MATTAFSTAFTAYAGIYQGRIKNPVNHTVTAGTWTYVLGHDLTGQVVSLDPDASIAVTQTASLNDGDNTRIIGRIRLPSVLPPVGWAWFLQASYVGTGSPHTWLLDPATFNGLTDIPITLDALGYNSREAAGSGDELRYTLILTGPPGDPIDVELPAIYIDAVVIDEIATPLYLNQRFPEPGQTGVPHTTQQIRVQLCDTTSIGIDTSSVVVTVEGVVAYTGDAFQAGFSGTAGLTGIANSDFSLDIDLSAQSYASEQEIDIRVEGETTGGANTHDETYSFFMADVTAPAVIDATAIEKRLIRVEFDEPVTQIDAENANDALNPANYVFARTTTPAANVIAGSVTSVSSTEVTVETDITLTFGAGYLLSLQFIEDLAGNVVTAPSNSIAFTGFVPLFPAGRRFTLEQMMPAINRREDSTGDQAKFLGILQETTNVILCVIDRFPDIIDIDIAPEFYIDNILCDLGNPFRFNLSLIDKRRLARILVDIYREKGTCRGIVNAVRFFVGVEIDCDEFNRGDYWLIGESELGDDTILGPAEQALLYSFQLISADLQVTVLTVNGNDDGDYELTFNGTNIVTFAAVSNTITQIRDNLLNLILADLGIPVTPVAVSTDQIQLTGDAGTAFVLAVSAPIAGNLTFVTLDAPDPFTDEQVSRIKEIATYMKPAHTHCVQVVQPIPPPLIDHWEIGISLLGETSLLH